jgi:hypothetical protein
VRMRVQLICAAGLLVILCGGCVTEVPFDRAVVAKKVSEDLRVPADTVNVVTRCSWVVVQNTEQKPPYRPCLYVATSARAMLLDYDENTQRYRDFARFDATTVKQIGFATFGRARQVQAYTPSGIYGFEVQTPSGSMVDQAGSRAAYEHLKSMGIPEVENAKFVHGALQLRGNGPFMIYIPMSR